MYYCKNLWESKDPRIRAVRLPFTGLRRVAFWKRVPAFSQFTKDIKPVLNSSAHLHLEESRPGSFSLSGRNIVLYMTKNDFNIENQELQAMHWLCWQRVTFTSFSLTISQIIMESLRSLSALSQKKMPEISHLDKEHEDLLWKGVFLFATCYQILF